MAVRAVSSSWISAYATAGVVVDDGVDAGDPPVVWIAMEYVPGCTLREAVARSGPLTPADALTLADALLDLGLGEQDVDQL